MGVVFAVDFSPWGMNLVALLFEIKYVCVTLNNFIEIINIIIKRKFCEKFELKLNSKMYHSN